MELDAEQNLCTTPHGHPPHTGRLDSPPFIPLLAPQKQAEHLVEYRMQRQLRPTLND